jgi:ABC-type glycerol-3-phosphate transport system substrate-binding protein
VTDFIPMLWASAPGGPQADGSFGPSALGPLNPKTKDAFVELAQLSADRSYGTRSQDDFDLAVYMLDGKATSSIMWSAYAMALANLGSAEAAMQNLQFGKVPGTPVVGAWLLAVPANREASQQKLAKGFAAFATSGEQLNLAAAEGNPPPRRSVMAARSFGAQYPRSFEAQRQSLEEAMPRPRRPDWKQVELRIGNCLADLSSGLIGPDDAFAGFNNAIRNTPGVQPLSDKGSGCVSAAAKAEVPRR